MDVNTLRERLADAINDVVSDFEREQADQSADFSRLEGDLEDLEITLSGASTTVEACLRTVREFSSF